MERFVRFIAVGGVSTVAGLWLVAFFAPLSSQGLLGIGLIVFGGTGLCYGTATRLDRVRPNS